MRYPGVPRAHTTGDFGEGRRDFKWARRKAKDGARVKVIKYGIKSCSSSFRGDVTSRLPRKAICRHPESFSDDECVFIHFLRLGENSFKRLVLFELRSSSKRGGGVIL